MVTLPPTPPPRRLFVAVALTVLVLFNIFHATTTRKETISCDDAIEWLFHFGVKEQQITRQSSQFDNKRLEFVHIPKTGGSSIESVTSQQGLSWGLCKFVGSVLSTNYSHGTVRCPDTFTTKINWSKYGIIPSRNCMSWHLPSYFFDNMSPEYNPFYNATLFAIVRDPYERMLSEYYYRAKYVLHWSKSRIDSIDNMNGWLTARTKNRIQFLNHPYPWHELPYCFAQGHFIPQRQFIYQGDRKVVDHVLRFENIPEEFDRLMTLYGLSNITLPAMHTFHSNKTMGIKDFTNQTRQLIEQVYEEDFATFSYPYFANR